VNLTFLDWLIMLVYFAFVLGVGFVVKRYTKTSKDFFQAGRAVPAWICGLAFLSANLGAQEIIGMGASGAKYGIATSHFYWVGAIPAMVFVGIFMMPFYYGSRARSVPEYLRLRFDEKTRGLNAISFAVMTIFSSGISMYAMAKLMQVLHVFDRPFQSLGLGPDYIFHVCIVASALIVLVYIFFGGLISAIYNEVLQFFLIVAGFLPLIYLGLKDVGGWSGIQQKVPEALTHSWRGLGQAQTNPMGVEAFGLVMGLGFVLSFGYWCTDFLVVQRAMAADSMAAARRTPLIAAIPKMLFPFLVVLPGLIALSAGTGGLIPYKAAGGGQAVLDYDLAIPVLLLHYFPTGMLGLGLTALLASFMSGMAGNVTAFNTVWTYDIYQAYIKKHGTDAHYLWMGRMATIFGIAASVLAAYVATGFNNIMDMLQLVFAFVNAPLFATFLLGMFWKRATGNGAFTGLLCGTAAAALHHGLTLPVGASVGFKGGWLGVFHAYPSEMAQNFWTAIYAWTACFIVTILVSIITKPRRSEDLVGLVYSLTQRPSDARLPWFKRPVVLGAIVLAMTLLLNIVFY
jgi:SSS family solute:Na+ symporter